MHESEIAIVGISCRFPGAQDIDEFWGNLRNGVESVSFFSNEELLSSGVDPDLVKNPQYVKARAVLPDIEMFAASFFGFSPGEAETMDPQQRIFLEEAWKAFEHAGYDPDRYDGLIGVYAGLGANTYLLHHLYPTLDFSETAGSYQILLGSNHDFITTRVSYKLNLKGPSVNVQTACSTSLVAAHIACQSLLYGECDMALAGGINIYVPQKTGYLYQEGMILSPDGHCRAFDAQANGIVGGNGVGIVVLKRLIDALNDGDHIHAIIKGTAINNDGSGKIGYTAPSIEGQAAVISEAQTIAGIDAETITYIETHGTGTVLGDPIEIRALTQAFRENTQKKGFCAIGSVKTNFGHLDAAAGVAGLIKAVLALEHKMLPPSLNFEHPNPTIDFENSPFYVNAMLSEWETDETPRRAGVSSFGIGGTNAHVVLEEFDSQKLQAESQKSKSRSEQLLVLSAKTESALDKATANLAEYLKQHPDINLADVAYTLQVGRKTFDHRRTLICQNLGEAVTLLNSPDPQRVLTTYRKPGRQAVTFMFPGQGAQYVNMGLGLYQTEPTFHDQVDRCSELLKPLMGIDLRNILYPGSEDILPAKEAGETPALPELEQTAITQPAIFVIEYALAKLWMEWGVQPQAIIGHSLGEYAAALLADVFSLEDALKMVSMRGKLMQSLPTGTMLSVPLPKQEIQPLLGENLSLAAVNAPSLCVISGSAEAVEELQNQLQEKGIKCLRLHTSHAFHSKMMDPILEKFAEQVKQVTLNPPQIPWVSTVTGTWVTAQEVMNPDYWTRNLRQTVRFAEGIQQLLKNSVSVLLEVGPGRTLSTLAKRCISDHQSSISEVMLSSLRRPQDARTDVAFLLTTLGKLWLAGVDVNWAGFYAQEQRHRIPLPTYPFERQRYWIETGNSKLEGRNSTSETQVSSFQFQVSKKSDVADWFYVPSWKRSGIDNSLLSFVQDSKQWDKNATLLFLDECGLGQRLAERLRQAGQHVTTVKPGSAFTKLDENEYTLDPGQAEGYEALFAALMASDKAFPTTIIHLWSVTPVSYTPAELKQSQDRGLYSLIAIAQALGKFSPTDRKEHRQQERNENMPTGDIRIAVISNGIHEVTGEEVLCPQKAMALGPVKIIPQEYPDIKCKNIDIVFPEKKERIPEKLINQLFLEFTGASPDPVIAYRGNYRWIQTFEPIRLETRNWKLEIGGSHQTTCNVLTVPRLREQGVYLITGGLGGIGLTLAEYLAKTVQARLILTGRSAFPAKAEWDRWLTTHPEEEKISCQIRKLLEIEALHADVLVFSADVADQDQMQAVIARAEERFGPINGVIHCAGVADYAGVIQRRSREDTAKILTPKVKGILVLDSLLKEKKQDFWILCSSLGTILYHVKFGQVGYNAANEFLDAFASYKTFKDGIFTVAINWNDWQGVGMSEEAMNRWTETRGDFDAQLLRQNMLTPSEGMEVFERILGISYPRVAVASQDLDVLIKQETTLMKTLLEDAEKAPPSHRQHARPDLNTAYVAARNKIEQTLANIWQEFLGIEQVGIYDDFFELGGDSLLGVRVFSRIRETFQIDIPMEGLFEEPTVAGLAKLIETIRWAAQEPSASEKESEAEREQGEI